MSRSLTPEDKSKYEKLPVVHKSISNNSKRLVKEVKVLRRLTKLSMTKKEIEAILEEIQVMDIEVERE